MINYQEQKIQLRLPSGISILLTQTDLFFLFTSWETIGIGPDSFRMTIDHITGHVIDAADNYSPTIELKRPLLFLRTLEIFFNKIEVG